MDQAYAVPEAPAERQERTGSFAVAALRAD
jgi:hypothetical protein